jgi:hypothetical protein
MAALGALAIASGRAAAKASIAAIFALPDAKDNLARRNCDDLVARWQRQVANARRSV